jgi:hypothetical protein
VITQSARVMNTQRPQRGIHQVAVGTPILNASPHEGMEPGELAMFECGTNADELTAAFQNSKVLKAGVGICMSPQGRSGHMQQRPQPGDRPPRKCANCGESHEARVCPTPAVAV